MERICFERLRGHFSLKVLSSNRCPLWTNHYGRTKLAAHFKKFLPSRPLFRLFWVFSSYLLEQINMKNIHLNLRHLSHESPSWTTGWPGPEAYYDILFCCLYKFKFNIAELDFTELN